MTAATTSRNRQSGGIVLLEVLAALTLFVIAAAVIRSAMQTSIHATVDMKRSGQAANIAQSVMAELEAGSAELVDTPSTAFEEEEEQTTEGWTYEIATEEITDTPGLKKVTVIVTDADTIHPHTCRLTQWIFDRSCLTGQDGETGP